MSDDLKPCPFCSQPGVLLDRMNLSVTCPVCRAVGPSATDRLTAGEAWNLRGEERSLRARIAALEKCVEAADAYIRIAGEEIDWPDEYKEFLAARAEIDK